MAENEWLTKDFYKTLGVTKEATHDEIAKAYRKLARKYHPDLNHAADAAEKFKDISEAYDVLSNEEQRRKYDAIRSFGAGGARFTGGSSASGFNTGDFSDLFGSMFGNAQEGTRFSGTGFSDLFSQFASGGMPHGFRRQAGFTASPEQQATQPEKGKDIHSSVSLTFRQAVKGATVSLRVAGSSFKTHVPAGVSNGQTIKIPKKGHAGYAGGEAGDLYLKVSVAEDPLFIMHGYNLQRTLPVTIKEAALGADLQVADIEGNPVSVHVPSNTSSGTVLRVSGHGIHAKATTGDLLLTVEIHLPKRIPLGAKKYIRDFDEATFKLTDELAKQRLQDK